MSFQLALSEIDKAREIGRRALDKIAFREEEEKLNVWMALVNLENAHGTPESFTKVLRDAAQYNDTKTVYLRTASVLQQTGKTDKAEELYTKVCKKFGRETDTWTSFAEFMFTAKDDAEAARALLPRSLKSIPKPDREFHCPSGPSMSVRGKLTACLVFLAVVQTPRRLNNLVFSSSVMEIRNVDERYSRVSSIDTPSD